mmetsp:Transcript_16306/g.33102  ORF Transcript_16306/g.33102 Transcript_16306/m.33102 type:complete len:147 (-) Transcript_16306:2009-2449(-)
MTVCLFSLSLYLYLSLVNLIFILCNGVTDNTNIFFSPVGSFSRVYWFVCLCMCSLPPQPFPEKDLKRPNKMGVERWWERRDTSAVRQAEREIILSWVHSHPATSFFSFHCPSCLFLPSSLLAGIIHRIIRQTRRQGRKKRMNAGKV